MLFPISDDDRHVMRIPIVTYLLLAANVLVFLYQMADPNFTYGWSVIPKEISTGTDLVGTVSVDTPDGQVNIPQQPGPPIIWITLLSSMFMHGGVGHIMGNMLYLYIFGNNVEDRFGHIPFLLFYLIAGLVGSVAQVISDPTSVIPNLGASGAIAGVMGAYLVLFPYNRVNAVFLYTIVSIPAIFVLGMWIVMQLFSGYGAIASTETTTGGVAYLAHIGGFLAGAVAALIWRPMAHPDRHSILQLQYEHDPRSHQIW